MQLDIDQALLRVNPVQHVLFARIRDEAAFLNLTPFRHLGCALVAVSAGLFLALQD